MPNEMLKQKKYIRYNLQNMHKSFAYVTNRIVSGLVISIPC